MIKIEHVTSVVTQNPLFSAFMGLMERAEEHHPNVLRVLTYHRIDSPSAQDELDPSLISATPSIFGQQMRYLSAHYRVLSMTEVLEAFEKNQILPPRAVLLTFDDGYRDFAKNAWPILRFYKLPATLFVPTVFPGNPTRSFWWDQLWRAVSFATPRKVLDTPVASLSLRTSRERKQAFINLKKYASTLPYPDTLAYVEQVRCNLGTRAPTQSVLDWDELRQLARDGLTIGAHSRTHPRLDELSTEQILDETMGSFYDIRRELGSVLPVFAYPGGSFNERVIQALKDNHIALAFTTKRGVNHLHKADRLLLRRINIGRHTTPALLRAKLLPRFASLRVFR